MRIVLWEDHEAPLAVVPAVLRNHEETAVHPDAGREPLRAGRGLEEPCVPAAVRVQRRWHAGSKQEQDQQARPPH